MIGGVAVAGKIVDRSEVAGRAQCVNAGSGVRCGGRSSRQERTKQEGAIGHLIDVVRAGLVDTHIADVTHRDCGIAGDLLLDGYIPLPGIGSDSARRSAAAGGSGCARQWNSGVQRPTDASCVDGEWRGIGEPYLRADTLALKELTA